MGDDPICFKTDLNTNTHCDLCVLIKPEAQSVLCVSYLEKKQTNCINNLGKG